MSEKEQNQEIFGIDDILQNQLKTDVELCQSEQTEKVWPNIEKTENKPKHKNPHQSP